MKYLKNSSIILFFCSVCNMVNAQSVKLQEGTSLRIALTQELSSKTAKVGAIVQLEVVDDVDVDGVIVIKAGTPVRGEITEATKAKMMGQPGKIDFTINFTRSVDEQSITLRSSQALTGKGKTGGVVAAAVFVAAPLIFIKGKDIIIEKGHDFTAYIDKDYIIYNNGSLNVVKNPINISTDKPDSPDTPIAAIDENQKRIALIIGNKDYEFTSKLNNPVNDANAIATELKNLGFDVTTLINGTQKQIKQAISNYGNQLSQDKSIVGLFYYSGHGIQVKGINYLVPIDAAIKREPDVEIYCVDIDGLLGNLEYAGNEMNVIILDACRSDINLGTRSQGGTGLATVKPPVGTLVAFATSPGSTASDGTGKNGLYTQELLKALQIPNIKIEDVFKKVRTQVKTLSGGTQIPWENSALEGDFYFKLKSDLNKKSGK